MLFKHRYVHIYLRISSLANSRYHSASSTANQENLLFDRCFDSSMTSACLKADIDKMKKKNSNRIYDVYIKLFHDNNLLMYNWEIRLCGRNFLYLVTTNEVSLVGCLVANSWVSRECAFKFSSSCSVQLRLCRRQQQGAPHNTTSSRNPSLIISA